MNKIVYPRMEELNPDGTKLGEVEFMRRRRELERRNRSFRAKLFTKAAKDVKLQRAIIKACTDNPLFFFNVVLWTFDPRIADDGGDPHVPFITYGYQDRFILEMKEAVENRQDMAVEKSRDMGFSWTQVGFQLWAFLFKDWASLYGTYKEDYLDKEGDMDSHFERLRYCVRRIPKWLKPSDIQMKNKTIWSKERGISITGDMGENFGTGGRRKFVFMDEFPLWANDKKAWRKTRDVTNCRIIGGTPEGKFNVYGKIMTDHPDFERISIKKVRLHWSEHPKKDEKWYEDQKKRATDTDIAKELDISYEASITGAVYKNWAKKVRLGEFPYKRDPNRVLVSVWDYGRDGVAILWIQKDLLTGRSIVVDAYCELRTDNEIGHFASFVNGKADPDFRYTQEEHEVIDRHYGWKYLKHIGDPYNGGARNIANQTSVSKELRKRGVSLDLDMEFPKRGSHVQDRIRKTTMKLDQLDVDRKCTEFYEFVQQAHYPKQKETGEVTSEKNLPVHDDTSHYRTCLEYYFAHEENIVPPRKQPTMQDLEREFAQMGI